MTQLITALLPFEFIMDDVKSAPSAYAAAVLCDFPLQGE